MSQIPPTNDIEDEEESFYVLLELGEYENSEIMDTNKNFHVIGLDTPQPILQLDDKVFRGSYEETLGTLLIFEQTEVKKDEPQAQLVNLLPNLQDVNLGSQQKVQSKLLCTVDKKLALSRVVLEDRAKMRRPILYPAGAPGRLLDLRQPRPKKKAPEDVSSPESNKKAKS
ncbi:general transcription factor 3C polypeptide 6 [Planoprotostelium fungivorum]|uniref:General transcription factor 3C polypeptide 6 n=1 Tax=Planoprotostelium fungivorum TaxID=1890364 RepID=A0A2P6NTP1_9EUKA|nr:general transcription factor 3C polypeptide 6 [Planoprotostelium fungivorum]